MKFKMTHNFFKHSPTEYFSEHDAPDWLTSKNTVPGSTMDNRWFWNKHILTLGVGETAETEFKTITRIE